MQSSYQTTSNRKEALTSSRTQKATLYSIYIVSRPLIQLLRREVDRSGLVDYIARSGVLYQQRRDV